MPEFQLINPSIRGNITNRFSGKTQMDAATEAWDTISKYMTNNVPKFGFSLENMENGNVSHFVIKEEMDDEDFANYKIKELDLKMKPSDVKKFKEKIKKMTSTEMDGGKKHKHKKHHDDSSSSSSCSSTTSDYFSALKFPQAINYQQPIIYWWYDPLIYSFESVYIPTFVAPLTPYIEIATINYYPY